LHRRYRRGQEVNPLPTYVVDENAIHEFADPAALDDWYVTNHATAAELWLKLHKKGSGLPSVSVAQSLDAALCWGWIDGIRKPYDEKSFLQRYTPRTKRSRWSTRNQGHVRRLIAEGRMRAPGQAQIDLAKADGRWGRAYEGSAAMEFPGDLLRAIEARPDALKTFLTLNAQNRYALAYRLHDLKTDAARTRKIETFVAMLARGESIYPRR
jgi:uncharacterized protein YdeI (YjbR/CyaY-like superfamily)